MESHFAHRYGCVYSTHTTYVVDTYLHTTVGIVRNVFYLVPVTSKYKQLTSQQSSKTIHAAPDLEQAQHIQAQEYIIVWSY